MILDDCVREIGNSTFSSAENLIIGKDSNIEKVGAYAFEKVNLTYNDGDVFVTPKKLKNIENYAFSEAFGYLRKDWRTCKKIEVSEGTERIGDYAVNIKEKAQELTDKEVTFSEKAQQELKLLDNALEKILTLTTDAFEFDDARTASQVEPLEQVIDILVERLRAQHIKRLKDGACSIDTGVVYLDVLNNVERISDHCSNIAARLVGMEAGEDYDSHTLKNMMHHNPTKEYMLNYEQCRKDYLIPLEQLEA